MVDSGADFCAFPLTFARTLGLDPLTARLDASGGVGSHTFPVYFWPIEVDLQAITRFDVYAGFTQGWTTGGLAYWARADSSTGSTSLSTLLAAYSL